MKKVLYSLLLLVLLSCGVSQPSSHNRITVQFRDSVIADYFLLSVRDSAVVIAPYTTDYISIGSLIVTAKVFPFKNIEKIYDRGLGSPGSILLPGFGGAAIGGCMACGMFGNGCHWFASDGGGITSQNEKQQWYFIGGGFILGAAIGYFTSFQDQEFSLTEGKDINRLRSFYALYPNKEPVELQKIK